jgi:hypothetical protein
VAQPVQLWAKQQPNGSMAILLLNMADSAYTVEVDFAKHLHLKGNMAIRDIWAHQDKGSGSTLQIKTASYDSAFYMLSPLTWK